MSAAPSCCPSSHCPPFAAQSSANILTLSPPLNLDPKWAGMHLAYTMAKYGMSLTTLGLAEELRGDGIDVNSLWPCTLIDTAAIRNMPGGENMVKAARGPEIMADAAHAVLTRSKPWATEARGAAISGADTEGAQSGSRCSRGGRDRFLPLQPRGAGGPAGP